MHNTPPLNNNPIFKQDAANTFVPWIIGLMIFLAVLSLSGTHLISSIVKYWDNSFTPGFTIEIPHVANPFEENQNLNDKQAAFIKTLENISGVESVRTVSKSFLSPFADPFARDNTDTVLLDVILRPGFELPRDKLKTAFANGTTFKIRDHREWRQSSINFAYTATLIGIIVATIIALAAVATIAFVASTGLQVHNQTIEILHLVGARRHYIAQQFQQYALRLALKGCYLGFLLMALTTGVFAWKTGFPYVIDYLKHADLLDYVFIFILTPTIGIFLTVLSARLTVLSALAKSRAW